MHTLLGRYVTWPLRYLAVTLLGRYVTWPLRYLDVTLLGRYVTWPLHAIARRSGCNIFTWFYGLEYNDGQVLLASWSLEYIAIN